MPKPKPKLTEEQIREAAYLKWLEDGAPHGQDQDYWFKAEKELGGAPAKKAPARKAAAKTPAAKKTAAKKAPAKKAPAAKGTGKSGA